MTDATAGCVATWAVCTVVVLIALILTACAVKTQTARCLHARQLARQSLENVHVRDVYMEGGIPAIVLRTGEPSWQDVHPNVKALYAKLECDNPGWKNVYFSGNQRRQFILHHFGRRTCEAYDKLVPGAFQADLFRYCAIYVLGGVWADFTLQFLEPIESGFLNRHTDSLVLCHDRSDGTLPQLVNALFAARPQHPFIKLCVDTAVRNIERSYYGESGLAITGPLMFRRAYDEHVRRSARPVPVRLQWCHRGNYTIWSDNTVCARAVVRTKHPDHYKHLGSNHKHYSQLWNERAIYRMPGHEQWNYPADVVPDGIPAYLIRTGEDEEQDLHPDVVALYRATEDDNPPWKTRYFSKRARRAFIQAHFDASVLAAYDNLVPNAHRSDLFRYCALFVLGGMYADFGVTFVTRIDDVVDRNHDGLVLCHDFSHGRRPQLLTGVLAARPEHPLFRMCIKQIVSNVEAEFYGVNALHPTGPLLLREQFDAWRQMNPEAPVRLEMKHYKQWHISKKETPQECAILCKLPNYNANLRSPQPYSGVFWNRHRVYANNGTRTI
jgi:mannosyltransferase OCH1-like enzyme